MGLTGIGFLVLFVAGLVLAFRHPVFGVCAYLLVFYNNPLDRWWGAGFPDLRWSLMAALVTLVALAVRRSAGSAREAIGPPWQPIPQGGISRQPSSGAWPLGLMLAMAVWMWLQSLWAVDSALHLEGCILFSKYCVLLYVLSRALNTRPALEAFGWAYVVGCFSWGWVAYRSDVHGRFEAALVPGNEDANWIGFQLVTGLAFAGFMLLGVRGRRRWLALVFIPFILNGVILTASRSSMLGLIAAGIAGLFLTPRSHRRIAAVCAVLGIVLFLRLAGSEIFWERATTLTETRTENMEGSAASRFVIAEANLAMFRDHPLGVGYRGNAVISPTYLAEEMLSDGHRSAHSTFLAILVDFGVPGAVIFLALATWGARSTWRIKRLASAAVDGELGIYVAATGSVFAAFFVCGLFINLLTAEVWLWMLALLVALERLLSQATNQDAGSDTLMAQDSA